MWIQLTLFKNRYKEKIIKYIRVFNILKIVVLVFYYRNILAIDIEDNKQKKEKGKDHKKQKREKHTKK